MADKAATGGRRLAEPSLFLLIDQLEEVFRPEVSAKEREALLNLIVDLHSCSKKPEGWRLSRADYAKRGVAPHAPSIAASPTSSSAADINSNCWIRMILRIATTCGSQSFGRRAMSSRTGGCATG